MAAAIDELQTLLAENFRDAGAASVAGEAQAQLALLADLQRAVTGASNASLPMLHAKAAWALPAAHTLSSQLRSAATAQQREQLAELANVTAASRAVTESVAADLFERRIFDPYLTFTDAADEAQYRQRETQARRYIDDQLVKNTPTGILNATGAVAGQMLDAHAHGAGDSPDFAPRWEALTLALAKQRRAMQAQGRSTEECDQKMRTSVRRYLASKGLSPEQIEAELGKSADPLDTVKPYLRTDQDAQALQAEVNAAPAEKSAQAATPESPTDPTASVGTIGAVLQARGVAVPNAATPQGHGVASRTDSAPQRTA